VAGLSLMVNEKRKKAFIDHVSQFLARFTPKIF
jgi:hypothetical protein